MSRMKERLQHSPHLLSVRTFFPLFLVVLKAAPLLKIFESDHFEFEWCDLWSVEEKPISLFGVQPLLLFHSFIPVEV